MKQSDISEIQRALKDSGFNPGVIDGLWGRKTKHAVIRFKRSVGLRARAYIGPLTRAALFEGRKPVPLFPPVSSPDKIDTDVQSRAIEPIWLRLASSYLGLAEYRGNRHNPKIVEWWIKLGLPFRDDETPWCAGFVCGVLEEAEIRSPRSAAARAFHAKGWGKVLSEPAVGAIASLWRRKPTGPYGHVAFVVGKDRFGNLMLLGGNQGNKVSIRPFNSGRVLSYHWPTGHKLPQFSGFETLPEQLSDGYVSSNEQ